MSSECSLNNMEYEYKFTTLETVQFGVPVKMAILWLPPVIFVFVGNATCNIILMHLPTLTTHGAFPRSKEVFARRGLTQLSLLSFNYSSGVPSAYFKHTNLVKPCYILQFSRSLSKISAVFSAAIEIFWVSTADS